MKGRKKKKMALRTIAQEGTGGRGGGRGIVGIRRRGKKKL
jgi:hypothetical protein